MTRKLREQSEIINLFAKYELNKPVPVEVRQHYLSRMRKNFKRIAKATGIYTLSFGIGTYFFFFFKKLGIIITTKVVVITFVATTIAAGGAIAYKNFTKPHEPEKPNEIIEAQKKVTNRAKIDNKRGIEKSNREKIEKITATEPEADKEDKQDKEVKTKIYRKLDGGIMSF